MITISNSRGWISNSISYAAISKIASTAHDNAVFKRTGTDLTDPCCDMGVGEQVYDYVLCGSVKKEYMDYLYQMSHSRANEVLFLRDRRDTDSGVWHGLRSQYLTKMRDNEKRIAQLMSGGSLQFDTAPAKKDLGRENYLIFRNKFRDNVVGIPLQAKKSSTGPTSRQCLVTSIPTYKAVGDIRIDHLHVIQRSGQLVCGGTASRVRFTKKNEPIVLFSETGANTDLLQRRLHNLWVISNEQQRLAKLNRLPLAAPTLELSTFSADKLSNHRYLTVTDELRDFEFSVQEKFYAAVERLDARLNDECGTIDDALIVLANSNSTDNNKFVILQEKIELFKQNLASAGQTVTMIQEDLDELFYLMSQDTQLPILELCKNRFLNFVEQMNLLISSKMLAQDVNYFDELCKIQIDIARDQSVVDKLKYFLNMAQDNPQGNAPVTTQEQRDQLRSMLDDPGCAWEQIKNFGVLLRRKVSVDDFFDEMIEESQ